MIHPNGITFGSKMASSSLLLSELRRNSICSEKGSIRITIENFIIIHHFEVDVVLLYIYIGTSTFTYYVVMV